MKTADTAHGTGEKIGFVERLSMGGFALANDLGNNFRSNYRMYFYTNVLALSPFLAGLVTMIGTLWDGINDPLIGYAADRHRFKNGEKIRPFAKWSAIPTALLFVLLFTRYDASMWVKTAISILLLLLFHTASTALQIALFGLPMVMTNDQRQRVGVNTFITAGGTIGVAIAAVALWPLIQAFGGLDKSGNIINEPRGFFIGAAIVALVYAVTPLIAYKTCKERIVSPKPQAGEKLWGTLKSLFKYKNWTLNLSFELIYYTSNLLMTSNLIYYAKYVVGMAICSIMFISNRADIVDVVAARTGRRLETIVSTLCTFVSKLAMSLVSLAIGIVLEACNYKAELDVQSPETISCLKVMMGIAPLVVYVVMVIVVSRMTLDQDVAEIRA